MTGIGSGASRFQSQVNTAQLRDWKSSSSEGKRETTEECARVGTKRVENRGSSRGKIGCFDNPKNVQVVPGRFCTKRKTRKEEKRGDETRGQQRLERRDAWNQGRGQGKTRRDKVRGNYKSKKAPGILPGPARA